MATSILLATLNARLVKHVEAEAVVAKQTLPVAEVAQQPSVLKLIDEAISSLPETEVQWSSAQRYPSGDFKQRCFRARETLCTLRSLLAVDE
jgi:hypothetical protein